MRATERFSVLVVCGLMLTLSGCPGFPRRNDGNGNGNGGTLSPQVQQAVNDVMEKSQATFQALAGFAEGFDPRLDDEQDETFGDCPVVVADRQNGTFAIELDFGDGCNNRFYPDSTVSGRILIDINVQTRSGSVQYDDFTVDGETISGSLTGQIMRQVLDWVITGDIDITISGVGSTNGTLDLELRFSTGTYTINDATLTLADAGSSFTASIENVVIRPAANGNFIPESGTISFEIPNDDPPPDMLAVIISFDQQSPVDRTVEVRVGSAPPVTYTLPEL